jgi:hypothetical protein
MATRNLRSRTAEFADTNVNVEVECTDDSSYRQSEALNDEERGTSAVSPLERQDPVSLGDTDTLNSSIVTNSKNDSLMSAQIQVLLADVLSNLRNIKEQNEKANKELAANLMAENEKLADRLSEKVQQEITKVTQAICQLREETKGEIQLVRDEFDKLSNSVDERIAIHDKSTKHENDLLRKEMTTELQGAKQEINTIKQDVKKGNQEIRDRFCSSELSNAQKFTEIDKQVADLREQMSSIAKYTNGQQNNTLLSDAIQIRPSSSGTHTASETCTSNPTCMNESVEIGCSHGNMCSMTPVNWAVPNNGSQVLPELALPKFSSRDQNAVQFIKDLDEYLKLKSVDERLKLALISKCLTEEFAKSWFMTTKDHIASYEEFKVKFLGQFWSKELQSHTRAQIYRCRYDKSTDGSMASHLLKYGVLGTSLQPPMSEQEIIEAITTSYPPWVQKLVVTSNLKTIQDALNVLDKLEAIEGQYNHPQPRYNPNRAQARSDYNREDHKESRTHTVRRTYEDREQRHTRNSRYREQQSHHRQETYGRPRNSRRNYSPRRNMTNVPALNPEATPYNQGGSLQGNETGNRTGNFRGTE